MWLRIEQEGSYKGPHWEPPVAAQVDRWSKSCMSSGLLNLNGKRLGDQIGNKEGYETG